MELLTKLIAEAQTAMEESARAFSIRKDGAEYTVFGGVKAAKERGDISGYYTIGEVETNSLGQEFLIVELLVKWHGPKKNGFSRGKTNYKAIDISTFKLEK